MTFQAEVSSTVRQNKAGFELHAAVCSLFRFRITADMSSPPKEKMEKVETKGGHLPAGKPPRC